MGFIGYSAPETIHILLAIELIAVVFRIIKGNELNNFTLK
ncbi:MAG TPA: hypothetical protein VFF35_11285 [Bacteroidia bacterium]|nr:hypothetical protein [Bacteroidia bacterium]